MRQNHLQALRQKHESIEQSLHNEMSHRYWDQTLVNRLKREKLQIKQRITQFDRH